LHRAGLKETSNVPVGGRGVGTIRAGGVPPGTIRREILAPPEGGRARCRIWSKACKIEFSPPLCGMDIGKRDRMLGGKGRCARVPANAKVY